MTDFNVGGWEKHDEITPDAQCVFNAAFPPSLDVTYKLVTPFFTQIVNGTNWVFNVEVTPVYPGAKPIPALAYAHERLSGEIDNRGIHPIPNIKPVFGGWHTHYILTAHARSVFEKAVEVYIGAEFELVAPYYTQVVAGTNWTFTVNVKPIYPDAKPHTAWLDVFEPLPGQGDIQVKGFKDHPPIKLSSAEAEALA